VSEVRNIEQLIAAESSADYRRLREYLDSQDTWGDTHAGILGARRVAWFSAEFGLHESLPIYSGGLGILAGDHIKSALDLGVPLIGIGLYWQPGIFPPATGPGRLAARGLFRRRYLASTHGSGLRS